MSSWAVRADELLGPPRSAMAASREEARATGRVESGAYCALGQVDKGMFASQDEPQKALPASMASELKSGTDHLCPQGYRDLKNAFLQQHMQSMEAAVTAALSSAVDQQPEQPIEFLANHLANQARCGCANTDAACFSPTLITVVCGCGRRPIPQMALHPQQNTPACGRAASWRLRPSTTRPNRRRRRAHGTCALSAASTLCSPPPCCRGAAPRTAVVARQGKTRSCLEATPSLSRRSAAVTQCSSSSSRAACSSVSPMQRGKPSRVSPPRRMPNPTPWNPG